MSREYGLRRAFGYLCIVYLLSIPLSYVAVVLEDTHMDVMDYLLEIHEPSIGLGLCVLIVYVVVLWWITYHLVENCVDPRRLLLYMSIVVLAILLTTSTLHVLLFYKTCYEDNQTIFFNETLFFIDGRKVVTYMPYDKTIHDYGLYTMYIALAVTASMSFIILVALLMISIDYWEKEKE